MALNQETKVGLLVLVGLVILGVAILLIGDFRLERGYTITILFNDISGLQTRAPVKTAGVQVGEVVKVDLEEGRAHVTVWIKQRVEIHADARATIASTGLIGTKYLELYLGTSKQKLLKEGDVLVGIDPISFDKIVSEGLKGFTDLTDTIKSFTGDEEMRESLKKIFTNFSNVMAKIDKLLENKDQSVDVIVKNFEEFSGRINKIATRIDDLTGSVSKEEVREIVANFKTISQKLDTTLTSLNNLAVKIEGGQGTLGKLITDEEMASDVKGTVSSLKDASEEAKKILARVSNFKTCWEYNLRYNETDSLTRNDFGIRIRPRPDKFYYIAVNNIKGENSGTKYDAGDQRYNSITATMGRDFGAVTLRGGLIRTTGGFGAAWRPLAHNNRLELGTEFFRFGRKVNGKSKVWINAETSYKFTDWLFLKVNYEDILEQKSVNATMNLSIEDDDIAYFLGLAGLATLAK